MSVLNRLKMLNQTIAAEIEASEPNRRAWVAIAPYKREKPGELTPPDAPWVYRVFRCEVDRQHLEDEELFGDLSFFNQEGVHNKEHIETYSQEEALQIAAQWLDDLEQLDAPWNCDYPF